MTELPRLTVDPTGCASYVHLTEGQSANAVQLSPGILVDVDASGRAIGVEVLYPIPGKPDPAPDEDDEAPPANVSREGRQNIARALDKHFPSLGPCLICDEPGMDARHRMADAVAGRMLAGESVRDLVDDYSGYGVTEVGVWVAVAVELVQRRDRAAREIQS